MALPQTLVFEVRYGGSDSNSGAFDYVTAGGIGTDYTLQDAARCSGANLIVHSSTNTDVLPDGYTAASTDIGNCVQIQTGTGWTAGIYLIKSIQSGYWRLDRSPAAVGTSGGTWAMGGALASPAMASALGTTHGITTFVKRNAAAPYSITSTSARVSGGCFSLVASTYGHLVVGYDTNRNILNNDAKPIIQVNVANVAGIFQGGGNFVVRNLELDGNNQTGSQGTAGSYTTAMNCHGKNFTAGAFRGPAYYCTATGCSTQSVFQGGAYRCAAYANTQAGFSGAGGAAVIECLSINNTGANGYGFMTASRGVYDRCVAWGNAQHGFYSYSSQEAGSLVQNCIAVNNGGYGYYLNTSMPYQKLWWNNAGYNNTSGLYAISGGNPNPVFGFITLTGDPFVDATNGNFQLNNTTGAGASCRNAYLPASFPGATSVNTTTYMDIGLVRHQDPVSGGVSGGAFTYIF